MALADNLVAYWALEEAISNTRVDSHNVGPFDLVDNNGVVPVLQTAGVSSGFGAQTTFTTDMGLRTPVTGALQITGDITISVWFRADDSTGIMDIINVWEGVLSERKFLLRYETATNNLNWFVSSVGTDVQSVTLNIDLDSAANWHHIVARFNDLDDEINLTVDDSSTAAAARTQSGLFSTTGVPLRLFQFREGGTNNTDTNSLDEVAIWSRAVTNEEITTLYNSGTPLTYDQIVSTPGEEDAENDLKRWYYYYNPMRLS